MIADCGLRIKKLEWWSGGALMIADCGLRIAD